MFSVWLRAGMKIATIAEKWITRGSGLCIFSAMFAIIISYGVTNIYILQINYYFHFKWVQFIKLYILSVRSRHQKEELSKSLQATELLNFLVYES